MKYYCNPLNLPYKYQYVRHKQQGMTQAVLYREAADPSLVLFKEKYFMFSSMTAGFFVSDDLLNWEFQSFLSKMPIYGYAPDVCVVGEYLYFSASKLFEPFSYFRTKDPLSEPFEEIKGTFQFWDPHMFYDDDNRLYFYWGCSNVTPIYGVELDKNTLKPLSDPTPLFGSDISARGYERIGNNHEGSASNAPFIEGAWITKYKNRYYLQYAAPGTEYNIYADGVYVSDKPLGPFTPTKNNPYSYKPGGFVPGAGHGSTLLDKNGSYWHISTNSISKNNPFERRLGLWKAGFDEDGELYCDQRYGDFPTVIDAPAFAKPESMLLSYGKKVKTTGGSGEENVTDENIHTWWKGEDGDLLEIDLGSIMDVHAVQINFADDKMLSDMPSGGLKILYYERYIENNGGNTQWLLEGSTDGKEYFTLCDKLNAQTDLPHDFLVWEQAAKIRFIKLTVKTVPHGKPCISGIRVFGKGGNALSESVKEISIKRIGDLDMEVSWNGTAVGYNVLWGYAPDKLYHSFMVFGKNKQHIGALIKGQNVFVRVDAFNECGITEGTLTFQVQ